MTTDPHTPGHTDPPDRPADPIPFARLVKELRDLDYDQAPAGNQDTTVYTTTDSQVQVEFDPTRQPPTAHLTHGRHGQAPTWRVTLTAGTPDRVQLMVLYAALNADTDPQAAIASAATALSVPPDSDNQPARTGN
jgi:hypothetical protein